MNKMKMILEFVSTKNCSSDFTHIDTILDIGNKFKSGKVPETDNIQPYSIECS